MAVNVVNATSSEVDYENPADGEDFSSWTVQQLKLFLRPRGARLPSRKDDLRAL